MKTTYTPKPPALKKYRVSVFLVNGEYKAYLRRCKYVYDISVKWFGLIDVEAAGGKEAKRMAIQKVKDEG